MVAVTTAGGPAAGDGARLDPTSRVRQNGAEPTEVAVSFLETIARAKAFLQEHSRVSLRAPKLEFGLNDETMDGRGSSKSW